VRAAFASGRIAFLVADWTNRDPAVSALLQAHARSGVPLYLYYAPGAPDAVTLPQILNTDTYSRRSLGVDVVYVNMSRKRCAAGALTTQVSGPRCLLNCHGPPGAGLPEPSDRCRLIPMCNCTA